LLTAEMEQVWGGAGNVDLTKRPPPAVGITCCVGSAGEAE